MYKTDPNKPDTDGDDFSDGVEVLATTNPLDPASFPGSPAPSAPKQAVQAETPYAWYTARASGLVGFLLLWVSIFLGLSIHIPFLKKIISPVYSLSIHCWISLYATLFALLHGLSLIFDKTFKFTLADVLIPFSVKYQTDLITLGILGFYLMVILLVTSYGRKFISHKLWRATHFTNMVLYVIVLIHAAKLGTDMKNPLVFEIFIWANALLVFLMLYNMEIRIIESIRRKKALAQADQI
jgi:sulfoxide reductase heme-binding subunit YedZ